MLVQARDDSGDEGRFNEGPRSVMDQHSVRRVCGKRFESRSDRNLSLSAAGNWRTQPRRKALRCRLVERGILWLDHHNDVIHAWMRGKSCDRTG